MLSNCCLVSASLACMVANSASGEPPRPPTPIPAAMEPVRRVAEAVAARESNDRGSASAPAASGTGLNSWRSSGRDGGRRQAGGVVFGGGWLATTNWSGSRVILDRWSAAMDLRPHAFQQPLKFSGRLDRSAIRLDNRVARSNANPHGRRIGSNLADRRRDRRYAKLVAKRAR